MSWMLNTKTIYVSMRKKGVGQTFTWSNEVPIFQINLSSENNSKQYKFISLFFDRISPFFITHKIGTIHT